MKLVILGETPSKKNSRMVLQNGKNIPSKQYRAWHQGAMIQVRAMSIGHDKICYPVSITLSFYHGDLRRRDSDNGTSSILDTLVDCEIIKDDNWEIVRIINVYNYYDKNNARCEIDIKPLETTIEAGRESA